MKYALLILLLINILNSELILKKSYRYKCQLDYLPKNSFLDMQRIPQDLSYYAKQIKPMSFAKQLKYDKLYNKRYFKPWQLNSLDIPISAYGWEERMITNRKIYTQNSKIIPPKVYNRWIENANKEAINSKNLKAITIKHTNLKAMPTNDTFYLAPNKSGYIFVFNYNQNSALYPNTPLFISHFSKDKKWAYVQAPYSFGWVKLSDIALVDKEFIKKFKSGFYGVAIKDNLRLFKGKKPISLVKLGTIFPIYKNRYISAVKGRNGYAKIEYIKVLDSSIIMKKPVRFNKKYVALVAKEFYNEPYGWGGGFGCRDCSATTRDFLGVFGIFLDRNSAKQAAQGKVIKIPKGSRKFKKEFIIKHANAFRSLLYVPGHIALYLGEFRGEPIIMHTYWGVRKKDGSKIITARTIITSLEAGKERSDTRVKSRLIYTLKTIINF